MKRNMAVLNVLLYFFLSYIGMSFLVSLAYFVYGSEDAFVAAYNNNGLAFALFGMISTLGLLMIIIFNYKYLKEKISYSISHLKQAIVYGVAGYFILIAILITFNLLRVIFGLPEADPENEQAVNDILKNIPLVSSVLLVGIIVPIYEELIFRVSVMAVLNKDVKSKSYLPYIVCALAFTLLHDQTLITNFSVLSLMNFMSYFILSLGLSLVYRYSNHNLLAVIIVHALNNSLVTILSSLI